MTEHYMIGAEQWTQMLTRTQSDARDSNLEGKHFWVAVVSFRTSAHREKDDLLLLDSENLCGPPIIVCATCGTLDCDTQEPCPRDVPYP